MYKEIVNNEIAQAMKNGNALKLSVWRAVKNEFVKFETSGPNMVLNDEKELQIIQKMVQQRKDSYEQYVNANRNDLANIEKNECEFLLTLLPKEPTEEEINNLIIEFGNTKTEKITMKDMKDVMSFVKQKFPTADGKLIANLFKQQYI
jgi:uncharacterized protein YqeY